MRARGRAVRRLAWVALASASLACTSGGGPGELGVYVARPTPTEGGAAPGEPDAEGPVDAAGGLVDGSPASAGGCEPGDYAGSYAGLWDASEAGVAMVNGDLDLRFAGGDGGALVATGTWQIAIGSVPFDAVVTGSLDCATSTFRGALSIPGTELAGVLGATYDATTDSLVDGQFSISFSKSDPPALGLTPNDGLSGVFLATRAGN